MCFMTKVRVVCFLISLVPTILFLLRVDIGILNFFLNKYKMAQSQPRLIDPEGLYEMFR